MSAPARLLLALASLLALAGSPRAEGLVQLTLRGAVAQPGGGPVEIAWGFVSDSGQALHDQLRVHLAEGTRAGDLAALLRARLERSGAEVIAPAPRDDRSAAVLFLDRLVALDLRLEAGLSASITVCEGAPESVRFAAPRAAAGHLAPGRVFVTTSTFHPHSRELGSVRLEVALDQETAPAAVCEALFQQGLERGLVGDRPAADAWRPLKTSDGALVTGCSIQLEDGRAGWGVQVRLAAPQ